MIRCYTEQVDTSLPDSEGEIAMQPVSLEEAKAHLAELMDAAMRGERVIIARDDRHAV